MQSPGLLPIAFPAFWAGDSESDGGFTGKFMAGPHAAAAATWRSDDDATAAAGLSVTVSGSAVSRPGPLPVRQ
jgi:hypothetical protein